MESQMPLNDTKLRALKPAPSPVKISDGGGLHILVAPSGSKLWRLAYRYDGRQKLLSFGDYPTTSLASARKQREEAKILLAEGIDPSELRRAVKEKRLATVTNTFGAIADEFLAKVEREGRADVTVSKKRWLLGMAKNGFGGKPITEVTPADILTVLRKQEAAGNLETAKRLRAAIGQVCRYSIATARAQTDPTYSLRGAVASPKVVHRAALTEWSTFEKLLKAIWSYQGQPETVIALKLMALLYPRPGELRGATWTEFDLTRSVWVIPAERTKMRRDHRKPLPAAAVELLCQLYQLSGDKSFAFESSLALRKPLSENTLNVALRKMEFSSKEATSHGFRASASSLLNESGMWSADAIEAELGHAGGSMVRRAYHRAVYWDERMRMADWWSGQILRRI